MRIQLNFLVSESLHQSLQRHCKQNGVSQAEFIRHAITQAMGAADTPAGLNAQVQALLARQAALLAPAPFHL